MSRELEISIGQYSDRGRKETNQDFHGALIPDPPARRLKGIAIALADGISSSSVSGVASETAVKTFLTDYYCTSDSWAVQTAAGRVIAAINSWLFAQTRRSQHAYDLDKGYVCTFSGMVLKSRTAHIFHVGDSRVYRVDGGTLEQLTHDHRVVVSTEEKYLGRALGLGQQLEIDWQTVPVEAGDVFVLATDGVYEHVGPVQLADLIAAHAGDLDAAARTMAETALAQGSPDNVTVQIVRVDALPDGEAGEFLGQAARLPLPPLLDARMNFDGYEIIREIHASSRSHLYLATDTDTGDRVTLKIPSIDMRDDPDYLTRLLMEEWIARRLNSAHVLKSALPERQRNYLYLVMEYVEGQTLAQWMVDNPEPGLEAVRDIVEQIARGLRAFHRMEMVHQDLRPENIMIDTNGTVKIIDFGSTKVAGVAEAVPVLGRDDILGTVQYTAPEYFVGEPGTARSDLFSLGVVAYQMLTGTLPYGAAVAKIRTKAQQRNLRYIPALNENRSIPAWVDGALRKAVHPDPYKRYDALSAFVFDLRHPSRDFTGAGAMPLLERNPLLFWKALCFLLACGLLYLVVERFG